MRGGKRNGAVLSTLTNRTPRRSVINRRHAPIQAKSRVMIKPAYLGGVAKGPRDSACSRFAARSEGGGLTSRIPDGYSKFFVSFMLFVVNFTGFS